MTKGRMPRLILNRSSEEPLREQLRHQLLGMMATLGVGQRLPTEQAIMRETGVSRMTVHRVLSELQHDGYVERRPGYGTYVLAHDKRVFREHRSGNAGDIIMAYPDWFSYNIWEKVQAAERLALGHGYRVVHFHIRPDTTYESLKTLLDNGRNVRGIILIPPGAVLNEAAVRCLDNLPVPVAVLVPCAHAALATRIGFITQDYEQLGYDSVRHFLQRGHTAIGHIANEPAHEGSRLFALGMKRALYNAGLKLRDLYRHPQRIAAWQDSEEAGYRFTRMLLEKRKPTALIYDSFPGAFAGLRALREMGVDVPDTISLLANEHYGLFTQYTWPALTTLATDARDLLDRAFDWLALPEHQRPRNVRVGVTLHERESVKHDSLCNHP